MSTLIQGSRLRSRKYQLSYRPIVIASRTSIVHAIKIVPSVWRPEDKALISCGVYVFRRLSLAYSMSMMGLSYVVSLFVQQLCADSRLMYSLVVTGLYQRESGGCR